MLRKGLDLVPPADLSRWALDAPPDAEDPCCIEDALRLHEPGIASVESLCLGEREDSEVVTRLPEARRGGGFFSVALPLAAVVWLVARGSIFGDREEETRAGRGGDVEKVEGEGGETIEAIGDGLGGECGRRLAMGRTGADVAFRIIEGEGTSA